MSKISEKLAVEDPICNWLSQIGWSYKSAADLKDYQRPLSNPIIDQILLEKIKLLNNINDEDARRAYDILVRNLNNPNALEGNENFLLRIVEGTTLRIEGRDRDIYYVDFKNIWNNDFIVTQQYWVQGYKIVKTDIVCLINGIPFIPIEAKQSARKGVNWLEGVRQFSTYSIRSIKFFQCHGFGIACNGHLMKFGIPGASSAYFFEWKDYSIDTKHKNPLLIQNQNLCKTKEIEGGLFLDSEDGFEKMKFGIVSIMQPARVLDLLQNFIVFERTEEGVVKKVARYQQLRAANKIVDRVVESDLKTGIVWHTQGSGKSLTMLYAAHKLRNNPKLKDPTVYIVIDRKDLVTQLGDTFEDCDFPNTVKLSNIAQLRSKIQEKPSEVIITTIQKFDELGNDIDERENVIVLIDEAHRTQYGDYHSELMRVLPKARRFAFSGTPIPKMTVTFGVNTENIKELYLDKYGIQESIIDNSTKPVKYTFGPQEWFLKKEKLQEGWANITAELTEDQKDLVARRTQAWKVFLKHHERVSALAADIAKDFREAVEPNGFKAQVVACDKEACVLYYNELRKYFDASEIQIVFSQSNYDDEERYQLYKEHYLSEGELKKLIKKFKRKITDEEKRNGNNIKIFIVCNMLLTGFDAPIEQTMYLDSPLRDHNLLQAIARTNRPYEDKVSKVKKEFGRVVDYIGVFKNYNEALNYEPADIGTFENAEVLVTQFSEKLNATLLDFSNINLEDSYECSRAIVRRLSEIDQQRFSELFHETVNLYEAISPHPKLLEYKLLYRWLLTIYEIYLEEFVRSDFDAELYAAKTRKLIVENSQLMNFKGHLPEITIDDKYLNKLELLNLEPSDKAEKIIRDIEIVIRNNEADSPVYTELYERLEQLIKEKDANSKEIVELITDLEQLFLDVESVSDMPRKLGFSEKGTFDIFFEIKNKLSNETDQELIKDFSKGLVDNVKKKIYSGWQDNDNELYRFKSNIKVFSEFDEYDELKIYDDDELIDKILNRLIQNFKLS